MARYFALRFPLRPEKNPVLRNRVVHIVDDEASVRRWLKHLLLSAGYEASTYDSPTAIIESATGLSGGCVLLDLHMPDIDGLELHRRLIAHGVNLPVIVITAQGDVPTAVKAIKGGAFDFIEKPFDDQRLIEAIESALATNVLGGRAGEITNAAQKIAALSPREKQVLDGLVDGQTNKKIAYDLRISVRTVEVHRAHLLDRLGSRSLAEAIRLSILASLC
jgi:two-component system response regulator FixJ